MSARDGRGASYMDQYDSQYDNGGAYDSPHNRKNSLGSCTKCTKHTLFVVNFVMLLVGVGLIAAAFFVKENSGKPDSTVPITLSDTVIWLAVASGALIIVVSLLGCVGATTQSRCILSSFVSLLVICLVVEAAAIVVIFFSEDLVKQNAEAQWNRLSESHRTQFENDNKCSTFDGCYSIIENGIKDNMFIVGGITIGIFVYQLVMATFACCLCCRLGKSNNAVIHDV